MRELTLKQERFCQFYICGEKTAGNKTQSYRAAYPCEMTDNQCTCEAMDMLKRPNVAHRIKELEEDYYSQMGVGESVRLDMVKELLELAKTANDFSTCARLVNELNKMVGGHKPQQIEQRNIQDISITEIKMPSNDRLNEKANDDEE